MMPLIGRSQIVRDGRYQVTARCSLPVPFVPDVPFLFPSRVSRKPVSNLLTSDHQLSIKDTNRYQYRDWETLRRPFRDGESDGLSTVVWSVANLWDGGSTHRLKSMGRFGFNIALLFNHRSVRLAFCGCETTTIFNI